MCVLLSINVDDIGIVKIIDTDINQVASYSFNFEHGETYS